MRYYPFILTNIRSELEDTKIVNAIPRDGEKVFGFLPGQYCYIVDPKQGFEPHPFSIASAPFNSQVLEFCIKRCGDWTDNFFKKEVRDAIFVSEPLGDFVLEEGLTNIVYLLGGIGIAPVMSMVRAMSRQDRMPHVTILYGNRRPDTIAYERELERIVAYKDEVSLVHIFSEVKDSHGWDGHRGFITRDIILEEVPLSVKPTFYVVGPPIFIAKMLDILVGLSVASPNIKIETLTQKNMGSPRLNLIQS